MANKEYNHFLYLKHYSLPFCSILWARVKKNGEYWIMRVSIKKRYNNILKFCGIYLN